jgi:hypothetical protein
MLVKMEVYNDGEFWCARGIGEDIFTQGHNVDELYANIREAVALHFENGTGQVGIGISFLPRPTLNLP